MRTQKMAIADGPGKKQIKKGEDIKSAAKGGALQTLRAIYTFTGFCNDPGYLLHSGF